MCYIRSRCPLPSCTALLIWDTIKILRLHYNDVTKDLVRGGFILVFSVWILLELFRRRYHTKKVLYCFKLEELKCLFVSALAITKGRSRWETTQHISTFFSFMVRSSSPDHSSNDIDDLSAALDQLRLAQARVDRVLRRLRASPTVPVAVPISALPIAQVSPLRLRPPPSVISVGDSVRINRPGRNQQSTGVVIGVTPSNFLQIRTPNGSVVLRQPHNVTYLGV